MMETVAGLDVGSRMTKAVLFDTRGNLIVKVARYTGADLGKAATATLDLALSTAGVSQEDVKYAASTGYGRYQVAFRDIQITEITCHGRGALFLYPNTRFVLDVGAMNSRAIHIEANGRVHNFRMNDKCASGAGRFLERVAKALEIELESMGDLSLRSAEPTEISNICAVLAESEVINLVTQGKTVEDILMGAHYCIADRIITLIRQAGLIEKKAVPGQKIASKMEGGELTLTGGVSHNVGMVKALKDRLGIPINVSADSEYAGAIGAALWGLNRLERKRQPLAA